MANAIRLPLKESFTVTFPKDANAVSILLNYPRAYSWLMNCFIQLTCWGNQYLDYYDFYYRNCILLAYQRIKAELAEQMERGVTGFIKNTLAKGYYVVLPVETQYIGQYDFKAVHDMMIYGYNDAGFFDIADNFSGGKYRKAVCSAEELREAISRINDPDTWTGGFEGTIELLPYRDDDRANFELYRVIESLQDYLASRATSRWDVNLGIKWDLDEIKNRCFGMQCYDGIFQNIRIAKEQGGFAGSGHRALFLEQEHKRIMELRLAWMKERYPISDDIIAKYHTIADWSCVAMRLKLKHDVTGDEKLLNRIEEYYKLIRDKEMGVLPEVISELENY